MTACILEAQEYWNVTPAVPPPGLVDLQHHGGQPPGPGLQVLLPHRLQVEQHEVQHAAVAHAGEEELVDVLLFWMNGVGRDVIIKAFL